MSEQRVLKDFIIPPSEFSDWKGCLKKQIEDMDTKLCTKEYGYVIKTGKYKIEKNTISPADSSLIISVNIDSKILKPEVGNRYKGKVSVMFPNGIFLEIKNVLKVLITISSLEEKGYKFSLAKKCFVKNGKKIKRGDKLNIKIECAKFEHKRYNCFASLE